ncbi:MAG: hypothetical protein ACOWWR_00930 [Eubacteriales bacterium]
MQYNAQQWMPYMQNVGVPSEMIPMVDMPQQELESMYPTIYFIVYPMVCRYCDMMDNTYGDMYVPNQKELSNMVDKMMEEMDIENIPMEPKSKDVSTKQWNRDAARDLLSILFLRELLDRRRYRRYPPYPYPWTGRGPGRGPGFGPPPGRGPGYYY